MMTMIRRRAFIALTLLVVLMSFGVTTTEARKTTIKGTNRHTATARKYDPAASSNRRYAKQQPDEEALLVSSHYVTNSADYVRIVVDGSETQSLAAGYAIGVFGYDGKVGSASNEQKGIAFEHPVPSSRTGARKASADTPSSSSPSSPSADFKAYSAFVGSPGEVLLALSPEKDGYATNDGITITEDDYKAYNPSDTTNVRDLNWTTVFATVMIAIRAKDIPRDIQVTDGILSMLATLFDLSNDTQIDCTAAYGVPDEEFGPVYDADVRRSQSSGTVLSLEVDDDWYSGMVSAKRRSAQQRQNDDDDDAAAGNGEILVLSVSMTVRSTSPDRKSREVPVKSETSELAAIPAPAVANITNATVTPGPTGPPPFPNPPYGLTGGPPPFPGGAAGLPPPPYPGFPGRFVFSYAGDVYVDNTVPMADVITTTPQGVDHRRWAILIAVACAAIIIVGVLGASATSWNSGSLYVDVYPGGILTPVARPYPSAQYEPLLAFAPDGRGWVTQVPVAVPDAGVSVQQSGAFVAPGFAVQVPGASFSVGGGAVLPGPPPPLPPPSLVDASIPPPPESLVGAYTSTLARHGKKHETGFSFPVRKSDGKQKS